MTVEVLSDRDDLQIRRLTLAPGESMAWHTDACHRFTVVVRGSRLRIEYRDGGAAVEVDAAAGQADWDGPEDRAHRAVNVGADRYEEVVTFYRRHPGQDPQPEVP